MNASTPGRRLDRRLLPEARIYRIEVERRSGPETPCTKSHAGHHDPLVRLRV